MTFRESSSVCSIRPFEKCFRCAGFNKRSANDIKIYKLMYVSTCVTEIGLHKISISQWFNVFFHLQTPVAEEPENSLSKKQKHQQILQTSIYFCFIILSHSPLAFNELYVNDSSERDQLKKNSMPIEF